MAQSSGIELPKLQMDFRNHLPNPGPHSLWATLTFPVGGDGKWKDGGRGEGMLGWISREKAHFLFHQEDFYGKRVPECELHV